MTRIRLLLSALALVMIGPAPGRTENYPSRPIHLVVPVPPGAINDLVARLVGESIAAQSGQLVVIENRAGAAGNIALTAVARAAPDGYTLLLASGAHLTTNRVLYKMAGFDPLRELLPIAPVADIKLIFAVNRKVPAMTMRAFIALAKAQPGKIDFTSAGTGSTTHLAGEWLARLAGIKLVHVAERGAAPAVVDVVAGNIEAITLGVDTLAPFIKSGELRALATASAQRLPYLPDVPAAAEAGVPGWQVEPWFGLFGPRGLAPDVAARLNGYVQKLGDDPATKKRMEASYITAFKNMSAGEFAAFVQFDADRWQRIIAALGIAAQ